MTALSQSPLFNSRFGAYLRLARVHQPVGFWLLMWPCWWALALASGGLPQWHMLTLFLLGAVLMRSAGCILNDLADRDFDRKVERTRSRPLASGELSARKGLAALALLLAGALGIALFLHPLAFALALASLPLVAAYPFMKRITWWPQAFLGITFNWGALVAYAAVEGRLVLPALLLYAACALWTLGYDTIYAHQDKQDDALIGIKSTALRLGRATKLWLYGFYGGMLSLLALAGYTAGLGVAFYAFLLPVAAHFAWQIASVDLDNRAAAGKVFRSNTWVGWLVFLALLMGQFF